ncbi:hypothetical protein AGMMS49957_11660 [Synergistales bacterium]|nr:hypothetical protein AGMMS49957_11660 [Synergistales bacterium]
MDKDCKRNIKNFEILGQQYVLPYATSENHTQDNILIEATVLFALHGYSAVSIKDIAAKVSVTPGALYNYFGSKEDLWDAVIDHAMRLYHLYYDKLDEALANTKSFDEVLDIMFLEPTQMKNMFTCYAFGLIQTEQFRNARAGDIVCGTFLEYGINFTKKWFNRCVERGFVRPFDAELVATLFMHDVMIGINLKVHESLGRKIPYDITEMFKALRQLILRLVEKC